MESIFRFNLLDKVVDTISGFRGTVIGRVEYPCHKRYYLQPHVSDDRKMNDAEWVDENFLALED